MLKIKVRTVIIWLLAASFVLAACAQAAAPPTAAVDSPPVPAPDPPSPDPGASSQANPDSPTAPEGVSTSPSPQPTDTQLIEPAPTNVRVDDSKEYSFSQLLPFDGIRPVYDPEFARAIDADLLDDELVMGIAIQGEAKAYPVTVLRFREMVNDELAGIPILVTW